MEGKQSDRRRGGQGREERSGGLDVASIVGHRRNDGNPHLYLVFIFAQPAQVFQNSAVALSRDLPVHFVIDDLDVEEEEVRFPGNFRQDFRIRKTAGVHGPVDLPLGTELQHLAQKLRLGQGLSPGEGNTTTGFVEERYIPLDFVNELRARDSAPHPLHGSGKTDLHAGAAARAEGKISLYTAVRQPQRSLRAGLYASTAGHAQVMPVQHRGSERLAFGIVTPLAAQGATFQKNGGADARTVMERVSLDVEDGAGCHCLPSRPRALVAIKIGLIYHPYIA